MFRIFADGELLFDPTCTDGTRIVLDPNLEREIGKSGTCTFLLPVTNCYYDSLQKLKTVITVLSDEKEIFRGRIIAITRRFDNTKEITCEGILSYLVDSSQKTEAYEGTAHQLFALIIARHNQRVENYKAFEIGEITVEDRDVIISGQKEGDPEDFDYKQVYINATSSEWETTLDCLETQLVDNCGGYLRARHANGVNYLDWLADYGNTASQSIEFGVNMLDMEEEDSIDNMFSVFVPIGDDNLTIESVNDGSDEIVIPELVEKYGRVMKSHVFSNVTTPEVLLENAQRFIQNESEVVPTVTINAVDMHFIDGSIDEIREGDIVRVNSLPHGITRNFTCTKISLNMGDLSSSEYTFGEPKQSLTQRYREDRKAKGGGGGGGAVGEKVVEETEKEITDFYDAWIDPDPDHGTLSLGATYKKLMDINQNVDKLKYAYENTLGIDIDAPNGTLDIYNRFTKLDELQMAYETMNSSIRTLTESEGDLRSRVEIESSLQKVLDGKVTNFYAQYSQQVTEDQARIDMIVGESKESKAVLSAVAEKVGEVYKTTLTLDADFVNIRADVLDVKANVASIEVDTLNIKADVASIETDTLNIKADAALLEAKVTTVIGNVDIEHGDLTLKDASAWIRSNNADIANLIANAITTTTLASGIAAIDRLTTGIIVANGTILGPSMTLTGSLVCQSINTNSSHITSGANIYAAGNVYANDKKLLSSITSTEPGAAHYHSVTVSQSGDISIGGVSDTAPAPFNIRDTRIYIEGVSQAVNAVDLHSSSWLNGSVTVTADNGKSVTVSLPSFQTSQGTFGTDHKIPVYFSTQSVHTPLATHTVDATSMYNAGVSYGKQIDSVYGTLNSFNISSGYVRLSVTATYADDTTSQAILTNFVSIPTITTVHVDESSRNVDIMLSNGTVISRTY